MAGMQEQLEFEKFFLSDEQGPAAVSLGMAWVVASK